MASKTIYAAVATVGIAAAAGGAYWYQNQPTGPQEITGSASGASTPSGAPSGAPGSAGGAGGGRGGTPSVEVAKVEVTRLQDDAQSVGTLRSKQNVMLRPEVSGRVQMLGFTDGGRVRRGDVIMQLEDALQRAEVRQAEASASIARANLRRNQDLVAQNFVAQRVLDESAASLQVAEAQVSLACARWDRMRVVAPFDGTVGIRNVNVGDYVKDGADLVNLEDLSSMFVDFRMPERFIGKLRREQMIEMQLDAMPGRQFKAKIDAIDPQIDANGRAVLVRATLPNNNGEPLVQRAGQGGSGGAGQSAGAGGPGVAGRPAGAASAPPTAQAARPAQRPATRPATRPAAAASAPALTPRPVDAIASVCAQFSAAGAAASRGAGAGSGAASGARGAGGAPGGVPGGAAGAAGSAASNGSRPPAAASGAAPRAGGSSLAGGGAGAGGGAPLRPGMFARVTAVFNIKEAALTVPEEAIVPQGGRQFVIRLVEQTEAQAKEIADKQAADAAKAAEAAKAAASAASGPAAGGAPAGGAGGGAPSGAPPYPMTGFVDGKRLVSQRMEVRLGIRRPGRVEITEGLSENDTVIVAGQQRVQRDNTPVRVIELGRPPAGAPGSAPVGAPTGASNAAAGGAAPAASASALPASGAASASR
ncbi:MAG: efflux RND transporter periplasmic adaptor subunit [Brachymonas sp.]